MKKKIIPIFIIILIFIWRFFLKDIYFFKYDKSLNQNQKEEEIDHEVNFNNKIFKKAIHLINANHQVKLDLIEKILTEWPQDAFISSLEINDKKLVIKGQTNNKNNFSEIKNLFSNIVIQSIEKKEAYWSYQCDIWF